MEGNLKILLFGPAEDEAGTVLGSTLMSTLGTLYRTQRFSYCSLNGIRGNQNNKKQIKTRKMKQKAKTKTNIDLSLALKALYNKPYGFCLLHIISSIS